MGALRGLTGPVPLELPLSSEIFRPLESSPYMAAVLFYTSTNIKCRFKSLHDVEMLVSDDLAE